VPTCLVMGYQVDVIGHIEVVPALNTAEYSYLMAFAESRRWCRPQGPWWVPSTPHGLDETYEDVEDYNRPPPGQPGLWNPWVPSCDGRCLAVRDEGTDGKNYGVTAWLKYLNDTFLVPGATASSSPSFEDFTFDHELRGAVAAHRSDTGELWLVRAVGGLVKHETVARPAPPVWEEWDAC
jgi:hypothetical protein